MFVHASVSGGNALPQLTTDVLHWTPDTAGIPSTVVIAASFDDVVAITGYSIFSSVAITGQGDVAWQIASGPLQVGWGSLDIDIPRFEVTSQTSCAACITLACCLMSRHGVCQSFPIKPGHVCTGRLCSAFSVA